MDYWVYPWPVEIVNQASPWAWLAPILALLGSALLFSGGLYGVHKTNEAAANRQRSELNAAQAKHNAEMAAAQAHHDEQLTALRTEGRADRAAERNDRFRQEVANLLGERWATEKAAYKLAENADDHFTGQGVTSEDLQKVRNEHTPQLNKVEHLAIRAALLTNDWKILAVLTQVRTAAQGWMDLVDGAPMATFISVRDRLDGAFEELEALTRQLVTSDGATGA